MNKVILMGRLTKDPELRYTQGNPGTAICRYSLAVNRSYKRDGEPDADFFNCVAFGNRGEFANKYLKKGSMIAIVGELRNNSYTDRDGHKRYSTEVVVIEHYFTGNNNQNQSGDASPNPDFAPADTRPQMSTTASSRPSNQLHPKVERPSGAPQNDDFTPINTDYDGEEDLPF